MTGWVIYRYFPESRELDLQDFVPVDEFVMLMRDIGFHEIRITRDDRSGNASVREFFDFASERHRASQLMAISDAAYTSGLGRLRSALSDARGEELFVSSEFVFITITGDKAAAQPHGVRAETPGSTT